MTEDAVIVSTVENLSMNGANPVEILLMKNFFCRLMGADRAAAACGRRLRDPFRLIDARDYVRSTPLLILTRTTKHVTVHRFDETIGGRAYQIDVTPVGTRWRAQLRRGPGLPTAMMPFYGQTPAAAARQLAQWLELAHQSGMGRHPIPR
jgi:hypothetical protein